MKEVFVVVAYRWGQRENHSYTVGCFSNEKTAKKIAVSHAVYRGGKYTCTVEKCTLDFYDNDPDNYITEVFNEGN